MSQRATTTPKRAAPGAGLGDVAVIRLEVRGIVQGVGFRPFVCRLGTELGLDGHVRNTGGAVEIVAGGPCEAVDEFRVRLGTDAPPLARIDLVTAFAAKVRPCKGFRIVSSELDEGQPGRIVPPDVTPCARCLAELFDPTDRRYAHPFISCTDCGPRFTIVDTLPYDRSRTSMADFPMCSTCADEYGDPADRRFHAEPIACRDCGPRLELTDQTGRRFGDEPIAGAVRLLDRGLVVAVKGLGGYHLACDARNDDAVRLLRRRKQRPDKPLAVMVANVTQARELFALDPGEEELLVSWPAPITLVRDRGQLAPSVAPGHRRHGVMLPSTPAHHLLLAAAGRPLVMTSGNRSGEAICIDDADARDRLAGIADAFLTHRRRIVNRCDDSVAALRVGAPALLRRARGHAPVPLRLPVSVRPTLAVGAALQSTFCLAVGELAYVSQHIGDLDNDDTVAAFVAALDRHRRLVGVEPEIVAHDLHPDLLSTRFAEALGLPCVPVQHHHAHVVSTMAEHGVCAPVIGVAFDGFGLGWDATSWGGDFFVADWAQAERVGWLRPVRQPGGDAAVRHPWRMALAYADDADRLAAGRTLVAGGRPQAVLDTIVAQARGRVASPLTSAAGRLFDAVAALAGICTEASYEGQAPTLLEHAADSQATEVLRYAIDERDGAVVVDTRPLVSQIVDLLAEGGRVAEVAGRFHHTLAAIIAEVCRSVRDRRGLSQVCLGGGVFANDLLCASTVRRLTDDGFAVYLPRRLPPGDGGLCLGQAVIAHTRHARGQGG